MAGTNTLAAVALVAVVIPQLYRGRRSKQFSFWRMAATSARDQGLIRLSILLTPTTFRLAFLFLLSFCSYAFLKDVSGIPSAWMPNDKLMHALVFCGLMLCWQAGFGRVLLGFVALIVYGGAVELAQHYFTNRMGDWWDWLADIGGLLLAMLLWHWRVQNMVQRWQRH